jgi:hypothetical protein
MKLAVIVSLSATALLAAPATEKPTYNKDVEPIMMNRCQECHRAGEIGPMPLMSYQDVRPWAKAIKASVSTKKMPPWFADSAHGKFSNDRSMSQTEIDTITAWVDAGAPEGDKKDKPAARTFVDGWNIPTPDLVVGMTKPFPVPAGSKIDYQYIVIPTGLKEDKWVNLSPASPTSPIAPAKNAASTWAVAATKFCTSTPRATCPTSGSPPRPSCSPLAPTLCSRCTTRPPRRTPPT